MFSSIRTSIISLFSALNVLFGAAHKGAEAVDRMADVALDEATDYRDKKRAERAKLIEVTE